MTWESTGNRDIGSFRWPRRFPSLRRVEHSVGRREFHDHFPKRYYKTVSCSMTSTGLVGSLFLVFFPSMCQIEYRSGVKIDSSDYRIMHILKLFCGRWLLFPRQLSWNWWMCLLPTNLWNRRPLKKYVKIGIRISISWYPL